MNGSRKKRSTLELGHDSFLDIVANLVGILIILVVVLGTQSQQVIEHVRREMQSERSDAAVPVATEAQLAQLASFSMRAASAQADSSRFERRIQQYDQEIDIRNRQRALLLDLLSEAQAAWEAEQQRLDQEATAAAKLASEHTQLSTQLTRLQGEKQRLQGQSEPVVAVEHLPTPMAKTVFGDEVHFRLKHNRLSFVPLNQLLNEIRTDFERVVAGSRDGRSDAAVGPVRGYVARYAMDKSRGTISRGGRIGVATQISLVGMIVEPLQEPHGEPIAQITAGTSVLDIELAGRDPGTTTVTVWVYPDSFAAFRTLKEHLYAKGFATAGRPLPMDYPISGSPHGRRSDAQ